jgi:hypothetical protein
MNTVMDREMERELRRGFRRAVKAIIGIIIVAWTLIAVTMLGGCDVYTAETVKQMDQNAMTSRAIANDATAGRLTPETMAYDLELLARGYQNLSDAGHWRKPTFTGPPTTMPTTLPWTPTGGLNPNK